MKKGLVIIIGIFIFIFSLNSLVSAEGYCSGNIDCYYLNQNNCEYIQYELGGGCTWYDIEGYCGGSQSCSLFDGTSITTCQSYSGCTWQPGCLYDSDCTSGYYCAGEGGYCSGTYTTSTKVDWNGVPNFPWVEGTTYFDGCSDCIPPYMLPCEVCADAGNLGYRVTGSSWYQHTCVKNVFIVCLSVRWSDSSSYLRSAYASASCSGLSQSACTPYGCSWNIIYGTCTTIPSVCGNGIVETGETCDDVLYGNPVSGDGCSSTCQIEPGYTCVAYYPNCCYKTNPAFSWLKNEVAFNSGGTIKQGDNLSMIFNTSFCYGTGSMYGYLYEGTTLQITNIYTRILSGTPGSTRANYTVTSSFISALGTGISNIFFRITQPTQRDSPIISVCTDNCSSLGYNCGNQIVCGVSTNCGTCLAGIYCDSGGKCSSTTCGDNIIAGTETCDDGNAVPGDGCNSTCKIESGFTCVGIPSVCTLICGDGLCKSANGENCSTCPADCSCNDYNACTLDTCSLGVCLNTPYNICNDNNACTTDICTAPGTCTNPPITSCINNDGCCPSGCNSLNDNNCPPVCGNGVLEAGEGCDDGNTVSGDGCTSNCVIEFCGDSIITPPEDCDKGGNMWVTNSNGVTKVSQTGVATNYVGGNFPRYGIAFDGTNMWTANHYGDSVGSVTKIFPNGTMTEYIGIGSGLYGIAFDGTNMWATNDKAYGTGANSVVKIFPNGTTTFYTGTNLNPYGIAFDGTNMWFTNSAYNSVTKISPLGVMTTYTGSVFKPIGIAFDGTNMWVTSEQSGIVTKIFPNGTMTPYYIGATWVYGIAFDGTNMWVSRNNGGVTKISPLGVMTTYTGTGSNPREIAFDGTNMWTANYGSNSVTKIFPNGTMTNYTGMGTYPYGIAFGGSNLGGTTCESELGEGWTGTLECSASCTFDTTACIPPCDLKTASWNATIAVAGNPVKLNITGTNCNGKAISFAIMEKDKYITNPDDAVTPNPANITYGSPNTYANWNAVFVDDTDGIPFSKDENPPEYYFIASVVGASPAESIESSNTGVNDPLLLTVYQQGDIDAMCTGINQCNNYITALECASDFCEVAPQSVPTTITCGNGYDCGCYWNDSKTPSCNAYWDAIEDSCGNNVVNTGETCDGINWGTITGCSNFDDFTGGTLSCTNECNFNTTLCTGGTQGPCGNNVVNTGETCDGINWGTITGCSNFDDFTGGTLSCTNKCNFNTALCTGGTEALSIGKCSYTETGEDTCEDDGMLVRYLVALWTWAVENSVHSPSDLLREAECEDIQDTLVCPASVEIPFFGIYNFIIVIALVILIYIIYSLRKKNEKIIYSLRKGKKK